MSHAGPSGANYEEALSHGAFNIVCATFIYLTNLYKQQYTLIVLGTGTIKSKTIPSLNCVSLTVKLSLKFIRTLRNYNSRIRNQKSWIPAPVFMMCVLVKSLNFFQFLHILNRYQLYKSNCYFNWPYKGS